MAIGLAGIVTNTNGQLAIRQLLEAETAAFAPDYKLIYLRPMSVLRALIT
jgi:hypothetical protein